jgi:hypothetical protein
MEAFCREWAILEVTGERSLDGVKRNPGCFRVISKPRIPAFGLHPGYTWPSIAFSRASLFFFQP